MTAEQQPLYAEGWRCADPDTRRPGETDDEYTHRMLDQCRARLAPKSPACGRCDHPRVVHALEADMIADPTCGQIFPLGGDERQGGRADDPVQP